MWQVHQTEDVGAIFLNNFLHPKRFNIIKLSGQINDLDRFYGENI